MKEWVLIVRLFAWPGEQAYDDTFIWDKYPSFKACQAAGEKREVEFAYYDHKQVAWRCEVLSSD